MSELDLQLSPLRALWRRSRDHRVVVELAASEIRAGTISATRLATVFALMDRYGVEFDASAYRPASVDPEELLAMFWARELELLRPCLTAEEWERVSPAPRR